MVFIFRKQAFNVEASDVVLSNIRDNGMNGLDFDMFVRIPGSNAILNQQSLIQAVEVSASQVKVLFNLATY